MYTREGEKGKDSKGQLERVSLRVMSNCQRRSRKRTAGTRERGRTGPKGWRVDIQEEKSRLRFLRI